MVHFHQENLNLLVHKTQLCCVVSHSGDSEFPPPRINNMFRCEDWEALMSESINKVLWVCYPGSSTLQWCLYYKSGWSGIAVTETTWLSELNLFTI